MAAAAQWSCCSSARGELGDRGRYRSSSSASCWERYRAPAPRSAPGSTRGAARALRGGTSPTWRAAAGSCASRTRTRPPWRPPRAPGRARAQASPPPDRYTRYVPAMRRTKIVATIGPASRDPETLLRMVNAGMDVARLNYSHGTLEEHAETVRRVRDAAGRAGRPVAILQDLPGPKLRIGPLREDVVELKPGDRVTMRRRGAQGDARHMTISWPDLADALELGRGDLPGGRVGAAARERPAPAGRRGGSRGRGGGAVASRQGLNIPGPVDMLPAVPKEDLELLRHGESVGVDMVALSFVRRPEDIEHGAQHTRLPLIAKMEKPQAVERAEEILSGGGLCDGGARGPRHRAADRAGADRAEGAAAPRRGGWRDHRSRPRRCSTRW